MYITISDIINYLPLKFSITNDECKKKLRINRSIYGKNGVMKYPKERKYGSNSDERETLFPAVFDLENKNNQISEK